MLMKRVRQHLSLAGGTHLSTAGSAAGGWEEGNGRRWVSVCCPDLVQLFPRVTVVFNMFASCDHLGDIKKIPTSRPHADQLNQNIWV